MANKAQFSTFILYSFTQVLRTIHRFEFYETLMFYTFGIFILPDTPCYSTSLKFM